MKLVFDTNVIVDVLTHREQFFDASLKAMDSIGRDDVSGAITANTITDIFFLYRKCQPDSGKRKEAIRKLMKVFTVLDTTRELCFRALDSAVSDFEDGLLAESAKWWSADCIVTRDADGFAGSPVEAISPDVLLQRLGH